MLSLPCSVSKLFQYYYEGVRVKQRIHSLFPRTPFPSNFRYRVTSRQGGFGTLAERYGERIRCFTPTHYEVKAHIFPEPVSQIFHLSIPQAFIKAKTLKTLFNYLLSIHFCVQNKSVVN
jgi:hypothetical protein